jgi:hypothetical protein
MERDPRIVSRARSSDCECDQGQKRQGLRKGVFSPGRTGSEQYRRRVRRRQIRVTDSSGVERSEAVTSNRCKEQELLSGKASEVWKSAVCVCLSFGKSSN